MIQIILNKPHNPDNLMCHQQYMALYLQCFALSHRSTMSKLPSCPCVVCFCVALLRACSELFLLCSVDAPLLVSFATFFNLRSVLVRFCPLLVPLVFGVVAFVFELLLNTSLLFHLCTELHCTTFYHTAFHCTSFYSAVFLLQYVTVQQFLYI